MHTGALGAAKPQNIDIETSHMTAQEFHALWELLLEALTSGNKPQTAHAALTYVYYWYNFMPLARGTAVTGYITLLAIFLAADMPITSYIPKVTSLIPVAKRLRPHTYVAGAGIEQGL